MQPPSSPDAQKQLAFVLFKNSKHPCYFGRQTSQFVDLKSSTRPQSTDNLILDIDTENDNFLGNLFSFQSASGICAFGTFLSFHTLLGPGRHLVRAICLGAQSRSGVQPIRRPLTPVSRTNHATAHVTRKAGYKHGSAPENKLVQHQCFEIMCGVEYFRHFLTFQKQKG